MSERERQRQLLREALSESHRSSKARTPPFAKLWSQAVAEASPPPAIRRRRFTLAAAGAVAMALVLAATIVLQTTGRPDPSEIERAMAAAAAVGELRSPLAFLLETPGREWLEATPTWSLEPAADPEMWNPTRLEPEPQRR